MQRISEQEILSAVGSFYEAAQKATREAWVDVWRQLKAIFRSGTGGFSFYNTQTDQFTALISDVDPELATSYTTKYQGKSRIRQEVAKLKAGERFSRKDLFTDEEFIRSDIYDAFYRPAGIFHFEYQVFLVRPGMHGGVSFSRPPGEPDFDAHELAAMKLMLPHLERAFQLYASLLDTGLEGKVMSAAFDRLATSLIVANSDLEIAFANNSARALLAENDGLGVNEFEVLMTGRPDGAKELSAAIEAILQGDGDGPGEISLIDRPSGKRPLAVRIAPFENDGFRSLTEKPLAILFVSDPGQSAGTVEEVLVQIYGLTPAEARFATLLGEHNDVRKVCGLLGIQESTGRTHLKRIYSKTGTNRQAALIKLILSGPASIQ